MYKHNIQKEISKDNFDANLLEHTICALRILGSKWPGDFQDFLLFLEVITTIMGHTFISLP